MTSNYFDSETFIKIDFTKQKINKGEYDDCTFKSCNFENIHASNIQFVACEFIDCNFSNAIVRDTAFKEVQFVNCKLLGVKFNECDPFLLQLSFKDCQLSFSSFYQLKLPNTLFTTCSLEDVDFTETVLTKSVFDDCSFKNAIFETTNLEKTDFRTSIHYVIDPENNRLKGARFSKEAVVGLLQKHQISIE